jgi:hypothetical protein
VGIDTQEYVCASQSSNYSSVFGYEVEDVVKFFNIGKSRL